MADFNTAIKHVNAGSGAARIAIAVISPDLLTVRDANEAPRRVLLADPSIGRYNGILLNVFDLAFG